MSCAWCEEVRELIDYCDIEGHRVCKVCYETYKISYPLRVEGCPYCKGNEEKVEVYIHSDVDEVGGMAIDAGNRDNTRVVRYANAYECERIISVIIIAIIVIGLMVYSFTMIYF
jgi:hypothetical protein